MVNIENLLRLARTYYPLEIESLSMDFDQTKEVIALKNLIKERRKAFDVNYFLERFQKNLPELKFRHMTYFFDTNASIKTNAGMIKTGINNYLSTNNPSNLLSL